MVIKFFDYLFFSRPMLMIPVWTVYLHYNAAGILPRKSFWDYSRYPSWPEVSSLLILTVVFAGIYVLNQIFDIDSDRINDKIYFLPRGILSIKAAWWYYGVTTAAGLIALPVLSYINAIAIILLVVLGALYSAPYVRLKDRAVSGLLANALAYGVLVPLVSRPEWRSEGILLSTAPYFLAIATGYILTTIPDAAGDAASGKRTLAVILGPVWTLRLAVAMGFATLIIAIGLENYEVAAVAAMAFILSLGAITTRDPRHVTVACKAPIVFLTILAGLHNPWYLGFLLLTIVLTRLYYKKRFGIVYPQPG